LFFNFLKSPWQLLPLNFFFQGCIRRREGEWIPGPVYITIAGEIKFRENIFSYLVSWGMALLILTGRKRCGRVPGFNQEMAPLLSTS
jgi:hypothetical protein